MDKSVLRKKVVDYMYGIAQTEWTPEESFILYNSGLNGCTRMFGVFRKGVKYKGMPYINLNMSQPESFDRMRRGSYIPFKGTEEELDRIVSPDRLISAGPEIYTDALKNGFTFPGNDCVLAVILAWNTVINNRPEVDGMDGTTSVLPGQGTGVLAVGDYDVSDLFGFNTDKVAAANGEARMAKAYAKSLPGDATCYVRSSSPGSPRHARLTVEKPHVEYKKDENGVDVIDTEKSYLTQLDQAAGTPSRWIVGENLSSCHVENHSFADLFREGSLPITLPELCEDGAYEDEKTTLTDFAIKAEEGVPVLCGKIVSNRQIISLKARIRGNNTVVERDLIPPIKPNRVPSFHLREFDLGKFDLSGTFLRPGTEYLLDLEVTVSGCLGIEQTLVKDHRFKA